jgi:hypothetical protein
MSSNAHFLVDFAISKHARTMLFSCSDTLFSPTANDHGVRVSFSSFFCHHGLVHEAKISVMIAFSGVMWGFLGV